MYHVTLNDIAYSILESVKGKLGDDDNISEDQIKSLIHSTRTVLLKQKFDKNLRVIDDVYTQSLGAVEIEMIDSSIVSTIPSGKYLYRTVSDIPETIDRRNYQGTFTRIGPAERKSRRYNLVEYERALVSGNGKFNRDEIYAFLLDNRIYLIGNNDYYKAIQHIDVIGVFQNPSQVARFKDESGNSLYSDDMRYPVSLSLRNTIEETIINKRLYRQSQVVSDTVNDATDTLDAGETRE